MKKQLLLLSVFTLLCFVGTSTSTIANRVAKSSVVAKKFDFLKLIGIGVEIHFGQSIPDCHCCYGGICDFKLGSASVVNGPLDDAKVGVYADGLLANDQAIIGIANNGDAYLIFNRRCSRPELAGSTLVVKTAPECDPALQRTYGIAPMKAGNYQIIDTGFYKMIRMN